MADIPINPVTRRVEFTGNTGTGPFAFTFNVLAQADIAAYKNNTLLALTSDYTVSLNSNGTGSITLVAALIASDELVIIGDLPLSRTTDFVTAGDLLASSLNQQFDSNVVMSQQLDERFDRTIRSQPGDINKNLYLPLVSSRASQLLSFDSSGNITTTSLANVPDIGTVNLSVSGVASFADGSASAPSITNIGDTNTGMYFGAADQINFSIGGSEVISISSTGTTISGLSISSGDILLTDNSATALEIKEGSNNYLTFITTNGSEKLSFGSTANPTFEVNGSFRQPLIAATTSFFSQTYSGATLSATNGAVNIESYSASKAGIVLNGSGDQITFTSPTLGFVGLVQVVGAITTNTSLNIASSTTVTGILDEDNMASNSATKLATQQSIKAYVDAQVGTVDTLAEVLGNGNTTGGTDIAVSTGDDITFADNGKAIFGAGSDLQIYSDGANSIIHETDGTGNLIVKASNINLQNSGGTATLAQFIDGGKSSLRYNAVEKLATTATGIDVTGNATFADNGKAIFGAESDLQIYHDGGDSIIADVGTGHLRLLAEDFRLQDASASETYITAAKDGAVTLRFNDSTKLATTTTGVDITGTLVSDGLTVDGDARIEEIGAIAKLTLERGGTANSADSAAVDMLETNAGSEGANFGDLGTNGFRLKLDGSANDFLIQSGAANVVKTRFGIDRDTGNISFYEDTGTTAKFFWDASAESLGIGTSSVTPYQAGNTTLEIDGGANKAELRLTNDTTGASANNANGAMFHQSGNATYLWNLENDILSFGTNNAEAMRIDSSGNVGIGVVPEAWGSAFPSVLQIGAAASLTTSGGDNARLFGNVWYDGTNYKRITSGFAHQYEQTGGTHRWSYAATGAADSTISFSEAMRIDSSGNLLVGTTNGNPTGNHEPGTLIFAGGQINVHRDGGNPARFGSSVNGNLTEYYKQGVLVGSIGTATNEFEIKSSGSRYLELQGIVGLYNSEWTGTLQMTPTVSSVDLGGTGTQWDNLFLSGGVYLGGTGAANKLDDYEEGTWTPVVDNVSGFSSSTIASIDARYTKIGRQVTLEFEFALNSSSGNVAAGDDVVLTAASLPFTPADSGHATGTIGIQVGMATAENVAMGYIGFANDHRMGILFHTVDGTVARSSPMGGVCTYFTT